MGAIGSNRDVLEELEKQFDEVSYFNSCEC